VAVRERTPITAALLARRPCLRLLITSGMRHAAIDVAAAKAQGVIVCGTDSHPEPAVEITWALILGLMRHLVPEANALRSDGPWQQTVGRDLHGARLGLLGVGKIGQRVAQIGQAFGMQVSAGRPNLDAPRAAAGGCNGLHRSRPCSLAARWCRCTGSWANAAPRSWMPTRWPACRHTHV